MMDIPEKMKQYIDSMGAVAETLYLFYKSIKNAGGTDEEAYTITRLFLDSIMEFARGGDE